jgi:small redox-active disulfide protein 2
MEIKVLGSGCSNCKKLHQNVLKAVEELNVEANILYVTDLMAIAQANLMRTPGLLIDGKVVSYGKVCDVEEVKTLISANKRG